MTIGTTDGESVALFLEQFADGFRSIDEFYEHPVIQRKLRSFCYSFPFRDFGDAYGPEDLYQDACMKLWKCRSKLVKPGNIMSEQGFFCWLFVLTRNQYYSRRRQLNRLGNHGWLHDETPIEDLVIAAPDDGKEGKYFLNRFLSFIKQYPEERRHVLKLWLQGYSYREIEKRLKGTPFRCSHVTVRNWVMASLDAFKLSLDEVELATHVSGSKASFAAVSHFHQTVAGR